MNIKGWIDELLKKLSDDEEINIVFYKERCYLPDASYAVGRKGNKEMSIYGNPPSLIRYGIAHLLAHELAHAKHAELYGDYGDDCSRQFKDIERDFIQKIWDLCLKEHEE